ncbi:MAG: PhnD/SsuA/transferrin family substrate-binding protein [Alphaproteobacteria bacterium]|nr:PhnD/SsuA/transferrin family substrate-binding protein [Alphaproteobacteria bacterium]
MNTFVRRASLLALAFVAAVVIGSSAQAEITLNFGVYATDSRADVEKQFRPALAALETDLTDRLGETVTIKLTISPTYEGGLDDLVQGRVDFTRLGPASYVLGKDRQPDLSILAIESNKGAKTFNGIICVALDSDIDSVAQLRGKSFAFGDDQSTIGRYLSQLHLVDNGILAKDLSRYEYLGRHDKVGIAVGRGEFDAGALKQSTFNKLVKKGVPIRVLVTFPNVTKPWVGRAGMDSRIKDALQAALLEMTDKTALKALKVDGMLPGADSDFTAIRQSIKENGRFFETQASMR